MEHADAKLPNSEKKNTSPSNASHGSRRGFFRALYRTAITAGAAIAVENGCREMGENIVTIETDNARHQIVYTNHSTRHPASIMEGKDLLILELAGIDYLSREQRQRMIHSCERQSEFTEVILAAKESEARIYFIDVSKQYYDATSLNLEWTAIQGLKAAEAIGGALLMKRVLTPSEGGSVNRRTLLKTGAGIASAYAMTPAAEMIATLFSHNCMLSVPNEASPLRKASRCLATFNSIAHPELPKTGVIEGRNALMAQKMEYIASSQHSA